MTLYRLARCDRCGSDYRAATPAEARSRTCPRCGEALGVFAGIMLAVLMLVVVLSMIGIAAVLKP